MKDENKVTMLEKILIFSLVGIVPFLVYAVTYDLPMLGEGGASVTLVDYFNYIKVQAIKTIAVVMLFDMVANSLISESKGNSNVTLKERIKDKLNSKYVFLLLIVISTLIAYAFSDFKALARVGAIERFEGIWTHFSYVIIFIYCLKFFKKDKAIDIFAYATLFSTFIVGGIGTLQFFGINPFATSFMKNLTYKNFAINIVIPGSFTTMYNTNTSGTYAVMMMFILAIILVLYNSKKIRAIAAVDFVLVFVTFMNSLSEASYIAFVVGVGVFALLVLIKLYNDKKKKQANILLGVYIAVFILASAFAFTSEKVGNLVDRFIGPEALFTDWSIENNNEVYFYNADDEYIKIVTNENGFEVFEETEKIYEGDFEDGRSTSLETQKFGTITLLDTVGSDGQKYINFNDYFLIKDSNETQLVEKNSLTPMKYYKGIGFERHPNLFTNRGFIWSRSIPMLLENPIRGVGSDVFFVVFPNDDYVGKAFGAQPDVTIDKPHNVYLNMAINNGILYLVGFIGIVFVVVKEKCTLLYKTNISNRKALAVMLYIACISGYLVNVLATDSLVVIVMLFWIILSLDNDVFYKMSETAALDDKNTKKTQVKLSKNNKPQKPVAKIEPTQVDDVKNDTELETNKQQDIVEEVNYDEIGFDYKDFISDDEQQS